MYTNAAEARRLAKAVVDGMGIEERVSVTLCPPFPYLALVGEILKGSRVALGAQNLYPEKEGAFTGEASPTMLVDLGCKYVILGHSERRHKLGESDAFINQKVKVALAAGLDVILCVGETLEQRKTNQTQALLDRQLTLGLADVSAGSLTHLSIAYEPVWAIGNLEHHATPQQAQDAHAVIRHRFGQMFGEKSAQTIPVQYGGSVKPDNAGGRCFAGTAWTAPSSAEPVCTPISFWPLSGLRSARRKPRRIQRIPRHNATRKNPHGGTHRGSVEDRSTDRPPRIQRTRQKGRDENSFQGFPSAVREEARPQEVADDGEALLQDEGAISNPSGKPRYRVERTTTASLRVQPLCLAADFCRQGSRLMTVSRSDALVLFGVTGDLAHKMIFPALYAMVKRDALKVPVIGVAFPKWSLERLRKRVADSIKQSGGIDNQRALHHLLSLFRYVSGDYKDSGTFTTIRKELGSARRPAHYLAIPPSLFETVIKGLGSSNLAKHARVIVEKPFGRDLASARELNRVAHTVFPEDSIFRIDHFLGKEAIMNILYF